MNFSQYTYSGLNFAGAGVEYSPEKWKFKAFGGRLKKAIEFDPTCKQYQLCFLQAHGLWVLDCLQSQKLGN